MDIIKWRGLPLSRMMLGTVQFGLPYGVANRTGQPDYADIMQIVATAFEGGVRCFDTAAAYGTSEEMLGRALHELRIEEQVTVVTKVLPISPDATSSAPLSAAEIEKSVEQSRQRLQLDTLSVVLFHREIDARCIDVLEQLRERGRVREIGVSCDNRPGPASAFIHTGKVAALQIPANVVDRRHLDSGVFELAHDRDVAVFVRSIFLQGLLLMPEDDIPDTLRAIIPARHWLSELALECGLSLRDLAVRYLLQRAGVTSVIVGVETVVQVQENLALFQSPALPPDLFTAIDHWNPNLPEQVLTPGQWPARPITS